MHKNIDTEDLSVIVRIFIPKICMRKGALIPKQFWPMNDRTGIELCFSNADHYFSHFIFLINDKRTGSAHFSFSMLTNTALQKTRNRKIHKTQEYFIYDCHITVVLQYFNVCRKEERKKKYREQKKRKICVFFANVFLKFYGFMAENFSPLLRHFFI